MANRRKIVINPDDPRSGEHAYTLYNLAHPITGDRATISRLKDDLRGLRGERVVMTFRGSRIDEEGNEHFFNVKRSFKMNKYADVFGPGSAYASAIHAVRERHSSDTLVIYSITID